MPSRLTPWPPGAPCWVDLAVPDVSTATEFYGTVLGWSFYDSGEEFGHYQVCQADGRAAAAIGPLQQPDQPTAWTLYLASDDADETARLISDHGGTLLTAPFDVPGTGRMCVALDPTGAAFGVWQASGQIGMEVYNEPGSLVWEDVRLPDPAEGKRFYAAVFGYDFEPVNGASDEYETFSVAGEVAGAMMGTQDGDPGLWMPYFAVADVDTSVEAADRGGGTVLMPATDAPFGRMAVLADPFDAVFSVYAQGPEEPEEPDEPEEPEEPRE